MRVCVLLPALALLSRASCQCLSSSDTSPPPRLPILRRRPLQPRLTQEGSPSVGELLHLALQRLERPRPRLLRLPRQHEGGAGAGSAAHQQGGHARPVQGPRTAPDAAAADINAFINAETRGKIPKLIEPSFVKDAKMVLTNAVYFKGFWKYPFKPQRTTRTMDSEKLHAQVLEMPYRGDAVSMVVLLPRWESQGGGQAGPTPEAQETRVCVEGDALRPADSQVSQDQRGEYSRDELISTLKKMGIRDLFSSAADLTDFTHVRGLMVNGAIHKALIEVDEEGAEAAAATCSCD
ncbi:putative leukocyte elastase inhibitor-like [Penaeus vannamei]|uniref:Putative leukocyte elastase inhibitor-like n=1 Tax=Penaeus vannamei TaxID=6689 RepID=A0A423SJI3_PENVA|nr:putative leukocyte elastase inhibitor-like [Penaeus vannamei]